MSQDWMDALREATEPPDAAVAELHARVLGGVGRRRRWPYWALAAVAALLMAVFIASRPAETEKLALHRPAAPVAPDWVVKKPSQISTPPLPSRDRKGAVLDTPTHRASQKAAAWIRLETADPNVVILLISEGDGE